MTIDIGIKLTEKEERELKECLYNRLNVLSEYHYDLIPQEADSLDTLMRRYFYWGDVYNDDYIPEKDNDDQGDKFSAYLAQEFEKFMAIPPSIRY